MSRTRTFATGAVVALVVLSGCVGLAEVDALTPSTDGPTANGTQAAGSDRQTTATATAATPSNGTLEVHFINVGQSVSALIVGPTNETMLVDSGDFTDDGERVLRYLERHNISRIDHLVSTHAHADHIGGSAAVIEHFETEADGVGAVYDPGIAASTGTYEAYLDAVEAHNVTLYETREGDPIPFEGVDVEVLGPPEPYLENRDRNENSIALRLTYGRTGFLLTGDAEATQERYLVDAYGENLSATVLKAGHHGSRSSTGDALLDAVGPKAVVISSANDSQYGHPHGEVLQRLGNRSIPTYWTATHGDIVFASGGERVAVQTQRAAPTDPRSLRNGTAIDPGSADPVAPRATINGTLNGTLDGSRETPVATDGGTGTANETETTSRTETESGSGAVEIVEVHADAAGDERENRNDEYVVFENRGSDALDLTGWTVEDAAGHSYAFPDGFTLEANATVTLHTGSGTDSDADLYWGSGSPIWNNGGDTVIVTDAGGETVLTEAYS